LGETSGFGLDLSLATSKLVEVWDKFPQFRQNKEVFRRFYLDIEASNGLFAFFQLNGKAAIWQDFDLYFQSKKLIDWKKYRKYENISVTEAELKLVRKNALKAMPQYPQGYVEALETFGISKIELYIKHGVDYADEYFQHIANFKQNYAQYGLTDPAIYSIFGYTSNFFYKDFNAWMRESINLNKTTPVSTLLMSGLNKLPVWTQTNVGYRAIRMPSLVEAESVAFAIYSKKTITDFWSLGSIQQASFWGSSDAYIRIEVILKNGTTKARDISALSDGILYRNKPTFELILPPGTEFEFTSPIEQVDLKNNKYWSLTAIEK
jgi:hypothetical protein